MNDRYIPPVFQQSSPEALPVAAEVAVTPPEWHETVQSIEVSLEYLRENADESLLGDSSRRAKLARHARRALRLELPKQELYRQLIDIEATIGGALLPTDQAGSGVISQRFWLDTQRDWHFEQRYADGTVYARYQIVNGVLYKSSGATSYAIDPSEEQAFGIWVQQYHRAVARELYKKPASDLEAA